MRMEGLQGGLLAVKLKYLDRWNHQRRQAADDYAISLGRSQLILPAEISHGRHVYHLYVVQADDRDGLRRQLAEAGVESGLHYPIPLHLQEAYRHLGYNKGAFPVTERLTDHILSLPIYPGISAEAIAHVAAEVQEICNVS